MKYPPFERVTAGKLAKGDTLLVRDRLDDQHVRGWYGEPLRSGTYTVDSVTSTLSHRGGRRASRVYNLLLLHTDGTAEAVDTSSVQRFNRVTGDAS